MPTLCGSGRVMWAEEFRPSVLGEVVGQEHITDRLQFMVDEIHTGTINVPHMLFAGRQGTGKTTTAIAFMKTAFGESWSSNWLELNASDERSISVIRTKVKEFASRGVIGTYKVAGESRPMPFNVVFLDECDNLTAEAQAALRRMMERYKQTRFILSANYPQKLIDPIKDRCAFADTRFRPIDPVVMASHLRTISTALTPDAMDLLVRTSAGSMRKAINLLWTLTRVSGPVELEDVQDFVVTLQPTRVKSILAKVAKAKSADPKSSLRLFREVDKEVDSLAERGMSGVEILNAFYELTSTDERMPLPLQQSILSGIGDGLYWASVAQDDILAVKAFLRKVIIR
jgi:replication factor C small subunit